MERVRWASWWLKHHRRARKMWAKKSSAKRNSTSVIWKYFGFKREDTLQTQVLGKSFKKVVATSRGNASNLHCHLRHKHIHVYKALQVSASGSKSLNYFSQVAIPQMYNTCQKTDRSEMSHDVHYAGMADLWSEPYLSLTSRFLTDDIEPKSRCQEIF